MNKYSSAARRDLIVQTLRDHMVRSQDELQVRLLKKGVKVAQPTLSRDIHELGIAKTPAGYVLPGELSSSDSFASADVRSDRLEQAIHEFVVSAEKAGSLLVVRTVIAAAQPVARAIDEASLPDVAGTLGGDDTIFVATRSTAAAARLARRFQTSMRTSVPTRA